MVSAELRRVPMPDGKVKSYGGVATVDGMEALHIVTGGGVYAVVPGIEVASGVGPEGCGVVPDGEMERNSGVTSVDSIEMLSVVA